MVSASPLTLLKTNRALLSVCVLVAAAQLTWGAVVPVLPAYAVKLDVSESQVGLIIGAFGLGRLLSNIPGGVLAGRISARQVMIVSSIWVVAATVLCGLATSFSFLIAARVMTGVGAGIAMTAGNLWIIDASGGSATASALAAMQAFVLASGTIGPAMGGLAASTFGVTAPFHFSAALLLLTLIWSLARRSLPPATAHSEPAHATARHGELRKNREFVAACVVSFAVFFARFGASQTLIPLLAYHRYGWSVGTLGVVVGVTAAANTAAVLALGGLSDRIGRHPVAASSLLLAVPLVLALGATDSGVVFAVTAIAFAVVMAVSGPIPVAYISDVVATEQRGRAIGISRTVGDVSAVVAPAAIGWVLADVGWLAAASMVAVVNVAAVAAFGTHAPHRRTVTHTDVRTMQLEP